MYYWWEFSEITCTKFQTVIITVTIKFASILDTMLIKYLTYVSKYFFCFSLYGVTTKNIWDNSLKLDSENITLSKAYSDYKKLIINLI